MAGAQGQFRFANEFVQNSELTLLSVADENLAALCTQNAPKMKCKENRKRNDGIANWKQKKERETLTGFTDSV